MSVGIRVPIFQGPPVKLENGTKAPGPIFCAILKVSYLGSGIWWFEVAGRGSRAWINSSKALCFEQEKSTPWLKQAVAAAKDRLNFMLNRSEKIFVARNQLNAQQLEEAATSDANDGDPSNSVEGQRDRSERSNPVDAAGSDATV